MKVFISWSGHTSHQVAIILRDWLPSVIQSIKPYVSSEDIDKGARWSSDIAGELDASSYGILCLTPDNLVAPWINFEAGALGKSVDKSRVSPFLFRIKRSEVDGPLLQFQSTIVERDDVYKLLRSMNVACQQEGLEEGRLEKTFNVWWPRLEDELTQIPQEVQDVGPEHPDQETLPKLSKVLEELLDHHIPTTRFFAIQPLFCLLSTSNMSPFVRAGGWKSSQTHEQLRTSSCDIAMF